LFQDEIAAYIVSKETNVSEAKAVDESTVACKVV
jgi:hypothetical protein